MTAFSVRTPFEGDAESIFKTVSDFYSYIDFGSEKFTRVTDDVTSFSIPISLGVFRLLLDGECTIIDRDLENNVSLISIESKDRGGKGKMNSHIRLYLEESAESSNVVCECDIKPLGLLNRVCLPAEKVFSEKISSALKLIIEDTQKSIVIDEFSDEIRPTNSIVESQTVDVVDKSLVNALIQGKSSGITTAKKPYWLVVIQMPAKLVMFPFDLLKRLVLKV